MENKMASCSWRSDSPDTPHQSQWLQTSLSDLDKKMKAMQTLLEENGDSLAYRAEMYYKKSPELIKMVEEFNRSYRSLAEKYDRLSSESTHVPNSGSLSPNSDCRKNQHISNNNNKAVGSTVDSKLEAFDSQTEFVVEDPDVECDGAHFDFKPPNEPCNMTFGNGNNGITGSELGKDMARDFPICSFDLENTWSELKLQVVKLMEENLQQQAELIKRNNEKRDAIKELRYQLDRLKGENRALQSCIRYPNIDLKQKRSQISILKGLILAKLFRGGSP